MALIVGELAAYLRLDDKDFQRGMSNAGRSFENTRQAISKGVQTVATAFAATTTALAALGANTLAVGLSYNQLQQNSRAALATLLGGAEAANAQMDKLDDFARNSPFAKDVFIQAQQQLLGFGMEAERVIPTLDAVQQAVAATGGSSQQLSEITFVLAQIQAAGKVTATDLMQLGQRGIDAATIVGEQMGTTGQEIRDMITAGKLSTEDFLNYLTTGMTEKFGGATAAIKEQMSGAVDSIRAARRDIGATLAEPLIDPHGGGQFVIWGNQVADVLRSIQKQAEPFVNIMWTRMAPGVDLVTRKLTAAKVAVDGFNMSSLIDGMDRLSGYTPLIAGLGTALFAMGTNGIPILGQLGIAINPVIAGIAALAATSPQVRAMFGDWMDALGPLLPMLGQLGVQLSDVLMHAIESLAPALGEFGAAIIDSGVSVTGGLLPALTALLDAGMPIVDVLADLLEAAADLPGPVLAAGTAFLTIGGGLRQARDGFTGYVQAARDANAAAAGTSAATGLMAGAMRGATTVVGGLGAALKAAFISNPVGLAITGLVAVLSIFGDASREAQQKQDSLASTLDQVTGAVTDQTEQMVAQNLISSDAVAKYEEMGGAAEDMMAAILGEADAREKVQAVLDADTTTRTTAVDVIEEQSQASREVEAALNNEADALARAQEATRLAAEMTGRSAEESRDYTNALQAEIDKLRERSDALDDSASSALNTAAAQSHFAATVDQTNTLAEELNETIQAGTHTVNGNREAFDLSTEAGRRSHDQLVNTARSANDLTNAMIENGHSQEDVRAAAESARESFIRQAVQLGLTEAAAGALADEYGLIPDNVVTKVEIRDAEARGRLQYWTNLNGAVIATNYVNTVLRTTNAGSGFSSPAYGAEVPEADGGVLEFYANGGTRENHVAQIAPAGAWRVWAEEETGGEAYIPLAESKRARSLDIWAEVGKRFGVLPMADGAVLASSTHTAAVGATTITVNAPISAPGADPDQVARELEWKMRKHLRGVIA